MASQAAQTQGQVVIAGPVWNMMQEMHMALMHRHMLMAPLPSTAAPAFPYGIAQPAPFQIPGPPSYLPPLEHSQPASPPGATSSSTGPPRPTVFTSPSGQTLTMLSSSTSPSSLPQSYMMGSSSSPSSMPFGYINMPRQPPHQ